jgi:serine/threonine-protein kinase
MRHTARLKHLPATRRRPGAATRRSGALGDKTWIQFPAAVEPVPPRGGEPLRARRCPTCHHRFSSDGRFCPFDASELKPEDGWDPRADPLIGTVVDDRYEILEVIGEGGMGTVYLAQHTKLGRRFALKALRRDLARDQVLSARFIQEARAAAAVEHPNVVQINDFGKLSSGQVYFVMEYLEGRSLSWLIRNGGPIPAARAVGIARQVAQALAAAHAENIVHRDLKPDNIHIADTLGEPELVKVLDFGLARLAGQTRLTRDGVVFGTPHYMSPEQAMGEEVDQRADIYALGIVMYEMFTGRVPFEADSYMGVLTKHMYVEPTPPSRLMGKSADLGALEDMTLRCLEKKPARRYSSMVHFLAELDRIARAVPGGGLRVRASRSDDRAPGREGDSDATVSLADALEMPTVPELDAMVGSRKRQARSRGARVVAGGIAACGALTLGWAVLGPRAPAPEPEGTHPAALTRASQKETVSIRQAADLGTSASEPAPVAVPTEPIELLPATPASGESRRDEGSGRPSNAEFAPGSTLLAAPGTAVVVGQVPRELAVRSPEPDPRRAGERGTESNVGGGEQGAGNVRRSQAGGNEIIDPWGP